MKIFKINKLNIIFSLFVLCLVFYVIFVARSIVGAIDESSQVDESLLQSETIHLNKLDIEKAISILNRLETRDLDL